jgi:spermidine synthase
MLPWALIDRAAVPGGGEMRLYRRGAEFSIRVGNYELMNSRVHASEDALASLACARLRDRRNARLLIGGLGMGFTLAAVLTEVGDNAEVIVAELVPEVVAWHRGPLAEVSGGALDDRRVTVRTDDVAAIIAERSGAFDAILLDVDNGPRGLTAGANDRLYSVRGLRAAAAALRDGGVLAVWSAGPDAAFTRKLQQAGFDAEEIAVRGRDAKRGPRFVIWIARRSS